MNKLSLALIIVISAQTLLGMEVEEIKPSPITLAQTYYYFAHDLLMPEIAQHIFFFHLGNVDPKELPDKIEQSCKDPESLVEYINTLINSCGSLLASELYKQFFPYAKVSICDIKTISSYYPNETSLHCAMKTGYPIVVSQILLKIAGDKAWEFLAMQNDNNITALHYAASHNNTENMRLLLNTAGDKAWRLVIIQNPRGWTALHFIASHNNTEGIKLLLNAAGDQAQTLLAIQDNAGCTALHYTTSHNNTESIQLLSMQDNCICTIF